VTLGPATIAPIAALTTRTLLCALALLWIAAATAHAAAPAVRDVLVVGNNWDGTADVVDPHTFERLTRLNIVPDLAERRAEILADPVAAGFFLGINLLIGEGHDQLVDDAFTSHDGRTLFVSRPSLADVVAIDLGTRQIAWRTKVEGVRSDHMAISPDGTRLLVSASTANKVHVIDTATGAIVGEFPSGDQPHENNFSADGSRIFHASIGTVYTPGDAPALDAAKGDRFFEVVDARTLQVLKRIDVGQSLAAAGFPGYSSAVRPMALAPDERTVYMQLSFLHGFVEFDLEHDRPLRIAQLPISAKAKDLPREAYPLDSAHHGIQLNHEGTKLCVAGTVSDYAAIVARDDFSAKLFDVGRRPYWATNSADGRYCFVSASGDDRVAVISYADERLVATIPVGDHPQRMRMGVMRSEYLPPVAAADRAAPRITRARVARGVLRLRLSEAANLRVVVQRARGGRWRTVRVVRRFAEAGSVRVGLGRLRLAGRHRVRITATDEAGNRSPRRVLRFRVRT
jgi:DNA-binding beta-propeller fold protein YncE